MNVFSLFHNYLPLEKGRALQLNKIESPFTQGCPLLSLVEIGLVVQEKKIFNFAMYYRYILIISPWKRAGPSFKRLE